MEQQPVVGRHQRVVDDWLDTSREGQSAGPAHLGPEPMLVRSPGGQVLSKLLHPAFTIAEELYRKLPEEAFFSPELNSQNPYQFELGAFEVPDGMVLWIMDYEFSVWRPSGVDPGDIIKAAESRFSGQMGWDLTLNQRRVAHLRYELDPSPISLARQAFAPRLTDYGPGRNGETAAFDLSKANSFAATSSQGLSLLPVRSKVQGARNVPFTIIAEQNTRVALDCVIFKTIRAPIAALQGTWSGYLLHDQLAQSLLERVRPR
jgi:hypothetical protein